MFEFLSNVHHHDEAYQIVISYVCKQLETFMTNNSVLKF